MRLSVEKDQASQYETGQLPGTQGGVLQSGLRVKSHGGFSLIELITVLVIVGILAVAAIPRMYDRTSFDSRAFYDQTISTLRYAQKLAIAQRHFVCVEIAGNVIKLTYDKTAPSAAHTAATCGSALTNPATGTAPYTLAAPGGVNVDAATFNFDALGSTATKQSINVSGYGAVIVEAGTGYVH